MDDNRNAKSQQAYSLGERAYNEKQYEAAVAHFTLSIKNSTPKHRPKIIDSRIKAYMLLEKFELALEDAKMLVRLNRTQARGYIRCGNLEHILRHDENAVKWWQQGLKKIDPGDPERKQLEACLARIKPLMKRSDPIHALPLEIFNMILSLFNYREHTMLLRVSKTWRTLLLNSQTITATVDFSEAKCKLSYRMFYAAIDRLNVYPQLVVFANLEESASRTISDRLQHWFARKELQHLEVYSSDTVETANLRSTSIETLVLDEFVTKLNMIRLLNILRCCPNLRKASFTKVDERSSLGNVLTGALHLPTLPLLESLTMMRHPVSTRENAYLQVPIEIIKRMPNLRSLRIGYAQITARDLTMDLRSNSQLSEIDLLSCFVGWDPFFFPASVRKLRLPGSGGICLSPEGLHDLHTLDLFECAYGVLQSCLSDLLAKATSLRKLMASFSFLQDEGVGLEQKFGKVPSLHDLRLRWSSLRDSDASAFSSVFPNLNTLVLEQTPITGAFVADIVKQNQSLRDICLIDCTKVSGDIKDWARQRDINLSMKNTKTGLFGGRQLVDA